MIGLASLALIAAFATPSLAAKTVIFDEELDNVTAAGEPKIAMAHGDSSAFAENFQDYHIDGTLKSESQNLLKALTLNNVFGENQVANATNVIAGSSSTASGQANAITQSWGAAKAWDARTVAGVAAPGGDLNVIQTGRINKQNGNAGNAAAAPGQIKLLWMFADEIADAKSDGTAVARNDIATAISGTVETMSQQSLTALTVNNVFGLNQVANGTNIASGGVGCDCALIDPSGGNNNVAQSNTINQYRGTPFNAAAIVAAAH